MKILAAEQPHFAPKTYWWNRLLQSDVFVIMDNDYFNRRHWQNKTEILLAGKRHRFTIPVRHGETLKINEVCPVETWGTRFRKTIHYAYANSRFYKKFRNEIFNLTDSSYKNLAELDMAFIEWTIKTEKIGSKREIVLGSTLNIKSVKTQYYIDLCKTLDCNAILVGQPTLASYLDLNALKNAEIEVRIHNWAPRSYNQYGVTHFEPNLSMLDAIFNEGNLTQAISGTETDYILAN